MMIDRFEVVEAFKHGDRAYQIGDTMAPPVGVTPAEVDAWHESGWIADRSDDGRLEQQPLVRGRHVIQPAGAVSGSNVEGAK